MKIVRGKVSTPRRTMLIGVAGIGKSTWAASAPDCLMVNLEDGLDGIDCAKTEVLQDLDSVNECLIWLATAKHEFKHVAIDSIDWLEAMIHQDVARKAQKDHVSDIGYGKGYDSALKYWDAIISKLDWLRTEIKMGVILLAHADVKKYSSPEADSYDRYQPALHKTASAVLTEYCDEVLFANYRVFTRKEDQGFNKTRTIAIDGNERYLRTQESPSCLAKNRLGMPPEIEFSWAAYQSYFPK